MGTKLEALVDMQGTTDRCQSLTFRIACEDSEFEEIYRLTYRTFVEEIPRYEPNVRRILIDQFHEENAYVICRDKTRLVGMMAIRGQRPFSLEKTIQNLDEYLPADRSVCEVRLLSIEKSYRHGGIFWGLMNLGAAYCRSRGFNLVVVSGILNQSKLYKHLGFIPFGPIIGIANALFQPMYLTLEEFEKRVHLPTRAHAL